MSRPRQATSSPSIPEKCTSGSPIGAAARRWRMIYFERGMARQFAGEASGSLEFETPCSRDRRLAARVNCLFAALLKEGSGMALEEALFRSAFRMLVRTREPERLGVNAANFRAASSASGTTYTAPLALSVWRPGRARRPVPARLEGGRRYAAAYILQLRARWRAAGSIEAKASPRRRSPRDLPTRAI